MAWRPFAPAAIEPLVVLAQAVAAQENLTSSVLAADENLVRMPIEQL